MNENDSKQDSKRLGGFGQLPENVDATGRQIRDDKARIDREIADLKRQLDSIEDDIRYHSDNMKEVKKGTAGTGIGAGLVGGAVLGARASKHPYVVGAGALAGALTAADRSAKVVEVALQAEEAKITVLQKQKRDLERKIEILKKTR